MTTINHTEDAGGLAKPNCANSGATATTMTVPVTATGYMILTWQMSATTGTPHVITTGGTMEELYYQ
jgi:hypothetical protein